MAYGFLPCRNHRTTCWLWCNPGSRADSDLVAGCAARLQALRVVPATVYLPILVKVDQIHQELVADSADKAGWVPADTVSGTRRKHSNVPAVDLASALQGEQKRQEEEHRHPVSQRHAGGIHDHHRHH